MDLTSEPQPAGELTVQQQRRTMNLAIVVSVLMILGLACLGGNVLTLAAIKLGAEERFIGFLNFALAIPFLASVLTISTMEKIGKRKLLLICDSIMLIFIVPIIFLPLATKVYGTRFALALLLVCTLLRQTMTCMGTNGWFPLLQDAVPAEMTGRFFGRMRTYWQGAWLVGLILIAWFLGKSEPDWWKFQVLFIIGFLIMAAKPFFVFEMSERPPQNKHYHHQKGIFYRFKEMLSKKPLRRLVLYSTSYLIVFMMAEPFKVKLLKDMGYSDSFIIIASAMVGAGAIISLRFWGKLADRFGNRGIFSVSHIGMIVTTLLWLFVEKTTIGTVLILTLYFLLSVFNSANGIARTRYLLHAVPSEKQYYINVIEILCNSSMAIGPLIGGFFLYNMRDFFFISGAMHLNNYHLLFIITAVLFVIPHLLRKKMRSKKETPTTEVLAIVTRPLRSVFGSLIRINRRDKEGDNSAD